MNCKKINKLLSLYIDKETNEKEAFEIEKHINLCGECSREYKILLKTKELLRTLPVFELPPRFTDNVYQAVYESTENVSGLNHVFEWFRLRRRQALAVSAAALILIGFFLFKTVQFSRKNRISADKLFMVHLNSTRKGSLCINRNSMTFIISNELALATDQENRNETENESIQ